MGGPNLPQGGGHMKENKGGLARKLRQNLEMSSISQKCEKRGLSFYFFQILSECISFVKTTINL